MYTLCSVYILNLILNRSVYIEIDMISLKYTVVCPVSLRYVI